MLHGGPVFKPLNPRGQIFDAYTLIADLVRKAKMRIVLIDNYVDDRMLKVLDKRNDGVTALIHTDPKHSHITSDLKRHNAQYPHIDVLPRYVLFHVMWQFNLQPKKH